MLLAEARAIAEEIATDPDSPRIQGFENLKKNFSDLESKYGKDGVAALFSALARAICDHCPNGSRDEAGVPDVLGLTDGTMSIRQAHLTYLVPDSSLAKAHQELVGGPKAGALDSSLRSAVRSAQAALDFQLAVTAAHAGDAAMEARAVAEYAQQSGKVTGYDRIRVAVLATIMTRYGR
ncbi:hypothetical protein [Streptomyces sp. 5-10]|uniref:hypothetical protein n=1 Tax=Streptomyces sp. 5-10 TaxID=878925 RepID=UPI00168BADDA|nr:hypothetical protein [Streptomyces sp. 5-10]MBD3004803.1 hypothetical protein [Streptomyces sp. 5-10]